MARVAHHPSPISPEYGCDAHRHAGGVTGKQSSGRLQPPQDGDNLLAHTCTRICTNHQHGRENR